MTYGWPAVFVCARRQGKAEVCSLRMLDLAERHAVAVAKLEGHTESLRRRVAEHRQRAQALRDDVRELHGGGGGGAVAREDAGPQASEGRARAKELLRQAEREDKQATVVEGILAGLARRRELLDTEFARSQTSGGVRAPEPATDDAGADADADAQGRVDQ